MTSNASVLLATATEDDFRSSALSAPAAPTRRGWSPRRLAVSSALALVTTGALAFPATVNASPIVAGPPTITRVASEVPVTAASTTAERPRNGAVLVKRGSGSGKFSVDNEAGSTDAVVTLSRANRAVVVLYVRAGASATVSKVPDGTFDVYAEQGTGWDSAASRFTMPSSSGAFDRKAEFSTEKVRGGIRYSTITLTLKARPNGNTQLLPLASASIPN